MTVEEVKRRYPMQEILARYGIELNRAGFCRCPFHPGDNTASLKVYPNNSWYCFGCGKAGDNIKFVQLIDGLSFKDACEWIAGEKLDPMTRRKATAHRLALQAELEKEKKELSIETDMNNAIAAYRQIMETARIEIDRCEREDERLMWFHVGIYAAAITQKSVVEAELEEREIESVKRKWRGKNRQE